MTLGEANEIIAGKYDARLEMEKDKNRFIIFKLGRYPGIKIIIDSGKTIEQALNNYDKRYRKMLKACE